MIGDGEKDGREEECMVLKRRTVKKRRMVLKRRMARKRRSRTLREGRVRRPGRLSGEVWGGVEKMDEEEKKVADEKDWV